jgi:hypothetical protein
LALFEHEAVEFKSNREAKATAHTDRFTDLLTATISCSRRLRRRRVDRFEIAFARSLSEFRADGRVPAYAPEWESKATAAPIRVPTEIEGERGGPSADVERIARRAARPTAKTVACLPDGEADALGVASLEWFTDEWEKRSGRRFPRRPVYMVADSEDFSAARDSNSHSSVQGGNCDFPAESEETASRNADKMSYVASAAECIESG